MTLRCVELNWFRSCFVSLLVKCTIVGRFYRNSQLDCWDLRKALSLDLDELLFWLYHLLQSRLYVGCRNKRSFGCIYTLTACKTTRSFLACKTSCTPQKTTDRLKVHFSTVGMGKSKHAPKYIREVLNLPRHTRWNHAMSVLKLISIWKQKIWFVQ